MVAVVLVPLDLSPMGFKLPSTCSPAISLDSPGSLTIKIRPLGADANSFSSLASKGSGEAVTDPVVGDPIDETDFTGDFFEEWNEITPQIQIRKFEEQTA